MGSVPNRYKYVTVYLSTEQLFRLERLTKELHQQGLYMGSKPTKAGALRYAFIRGVTILEKELKIQGEIPQDQKKGRVKAEPKMLPLADVLSIDESIDEDLTSVTSPVEETDEELINAFGNSDDA